MIKPTIGSVVWYHPPDSASTQQPLAALVAYVWSDNCVNLAVFSPTGVATNVTSVYLFQGDGESPVYSYAEWMPYQKDQAVKTETLES